MSEELFPSGPWVGFYNYRPGNRHRMDLRLEFAGGMVIGEGIDNVGRFVVRGRYDVANREAHWSKSYIGRHDVFYRGFREGKGIWGTWEIRERLRQVLHETAAQTLLDVRTPFTLMYCPALGLFPYGISGAAVEDVGGS